MQNRLSESRFLPWASHLGRRWLAGAALVMAMQCLAVSVCLAAQSQSFSIPSQSTHVGAGKASSASFAVESCLGHSPAGSSSSASFSLQSGCAASYLTVNDIDDLVPEYLFEAIPALSSKWAAVLFLAMAMLTMAAPIIRRDTR